ncbi:5-formyltetrahydrofolate cyclo-ligase [Hyphobacterium sp. HN65]|uniref:5-formyltetrahydrofolate cyclo-ligase n=1 Tax=Hyphobacterium lacteum TaxID=3116575 RepID=A0ABU7LPQ0_9PROT|nr:5-formyltetrahydrofolate cyclo-ligase [Hyphobacterium sp. HN65]MEE2525889.1 5-formyltetrahydrofolate cyclo-ligase [Hyphobacterium sp. HN65]
MISGFRKRWARKKALTRRAQILGDRDVLARALVDRFPSDIWPRIGQVVSGYVPFGTEIDSFPLMETFFCEQVSLCLPVVAERTNALMFRKWEPADGLGNGLCGNLEPLSDKPEMTPSLLIVPLLSFDAKGHRLGYGGGYYDRTLSGLRAGGVPVTAVGIAFEEQLVASVPTAKNDQSLDLVITPSRVFQP